MIETHPPAPEELEISLFGPGIGECIVAHLGRGEWMIVDSCLEPHTKVPIALSYLNKIGIDVASAVKLIVISHWHDDHIGGAAQVVAACRNAKVFYSSALLKEEFITMYEALSNPLSLVDIDKPSTRQIAAIVHILEKRLKAEPNRRIELLEGVTAHNRLFFRTQGWSTEVWALSPSSTSIHKALLQIASLLPIPNDDNRNSRGVVPRLTPNYSAVVIWIQFGHRYILLGSDLEEKKDPTIGWTAIVQSDRRPQGKASIFKIPHHGSKTAHCPEVWTEMVESQSTGILTTYGRGKQPLPSLQDIERLKNLTSQLYCTLEPKGRVNRRDAAVEKMMKSVVKSRKVLGGEIGQIQVRMGLDSKIRVGLKLPAVLL